MHARRFAADGRGRVVVALIVLLAVPSTGFAQREPFFAAVVAFYRSLAGVYGDEGPQLAAQLAAMSASLERWDYQIRDAEAEMLPRLRTTADVPAVLQLHTTLASLYLERGRWLDALRHFEADIAIDPRRAAFHRLRGLVLQTIGRPTDAADAFRAAWLLDPDDPQNAYRLIAARSEQTGPEDVGRARHALADLERRLIRGAHAAQPLLFTHLSGIVDDAGGGLAFVPAAYAHGFSLVLQGEYERGVAQLRAALTTDPLVADAAPRAEMMIRGIAALREGAAAVAIQALEDAVSVAPTSSEVHRVLGTAYAMGGHVTSSVQHLTDAVRLNPRDERARLALARTLATAGQLAESEAVLRKAIAELPDASALRWQLSIRAQAGRDEDDRALIEMADRVVLLVGKGEFYRSLAGLARIHLDDATATALLERAVRLTPNNVAAHKALARAHVDNGRATEGYAELVIALLLEPGDVETLTALGQWHLAEDQPALAVDALERATAIDPVNRLAIHALATALIRAGNVDAGKQRLLESERLQAQAIERDRQVKAAAVLRLTADMRMTNRDYAGAIAAWQQVIAMQPATAGNHLRLAEALTAAGRLENAVAEYRTAIALGAPADAHRRLAELYDALGRRVDASRERQAHVVRRQDELRQRADAGVFGF